MGRMKQKRESRGKRGKSGGSAPENRRAEALTVAWMVSVLATLCAVLLGAAGIVLAPPANAEGAAGNLWSTVTPLMLFTGFVTGLVSLCLTPLVHIYRRVPPPWLITVLALMIALSPLALLTFSAAR